MKRRFVSLLIVMAMCLGLLPTASMATEVPVPEQKIMLGTDALTGYDNGYKYIYMGWWDSHARAWCKSFESSALNNVESMEKTAVMAVDS